MATVRESTPFSTARASEVPLKRAPLARVLVQARWDELASLGADFEARAKAIGARAGDDYPLASRSAEAQFQVGPAGVSQLNGPIVHRFASVDDSWRFYLAPTFATLETSAYTNRHDFSERFERILTWVAEVITIPRCVRVGFRYVNRIDEPDEYQKVPALVRDEVLGGRSVPLGNASLNHSLTEALYSTEAGSLLAKWAWLPAGATIDPTLDPTLNPSWILDLDAFDESPTSFSPAAIADRSRELSSLGYNFFRWAVKDDFLRMFGGDPGED